MRFGVFAPLLAEVPHCFFKSPKPSEAHLKEWYEQVLPHYLQTGAIERLDARPNWCYKAFFVDKRDGGLRLIIDLRPLNVFFPICSVKYESLSFLRFVPRDCVSAVSLDLQDGYHHLRLHPAIRHLFNFEFDG